MLALLEDGRVSLNDKVDTGNGTYRFYDRNMNDAKNGGFGEITVREVFEKSSNIGISKLVDQYFGKSPSKFVSYVEKVGLDKPIDFQLKGEGVPYFKKPGEQHWYGTTLPWMSIGYEAKLTPLHTLMLYNAVANNGTMVKPMIVQAIAKGNHLEKRFETEVLRKSIASEKTIKLLQELLIGVVENGTAKNIFTEDYKIGGKTGTAQKLVDGRYTKKYYTSFVGFFPADNPKYSAIVVIDSPKGFNAYGGDISAPVFKEIADKIHAQDLDLNKRANERILIAQDQLQFPSIPAGKLDELQLICNRFGISNHGSTTGDNWVKSVAQTKSIQWETNQTENEGVPDVSGMPLRDALYVLENKGLRVVYQGKGRVKNQSIRPGSAIEKNTNVINLILG